MSGFVGVVNWERPLPAEVMSGTVDLLQRPGWLAESLVDPAASFVVGRTHLGSLPTRSHLGVAEPVQVLLEGELTSVARIAADLGIQAAGQPDARLVASIYRAGGIPGLARLKGAFAAAIVDTERREVVLVADRLGSHPVYWAVSDGRLCFASELRSLLKLRGAKTVLEPRAVADYIAFGFVTRNCTLAAGVEMVGPGSTVRWNGGGSPRVETHAELVGLFARRNQSREAYTARVVEAFGDAVQRAAAPPGPLGMSLSGGLDSRAILAALDGSATSTESYTLGVAGCADEVVAARLSRTAGTRHTFYELDSSYLKDFLGQLREMVRLTDGMYLSHGLTEMLALQFLKRASFRVLLRGHCGELAKTSLAWPLHTDERVYALNTTSDFVDYLLRRLTYVSGDLDRVNVFTEAWRAQMADARRASLDEIVRDVPLKPAELCAYLYLREHHRRFTVPSLELFRDAVEVRLPFADERFLEVLLSGPPEWRDSTALHRAIIAHHDPRLLKVRDSNTGVSVDAGRWRTAVGDKLNTVLKRLNVHGYRHYHNFEVWMERMLVEAVESELLSERSLDRGILERDRLQALVDGARRGERGYSYLLQILLIIELWQQQTVDGQVH